MEPGKGEEFKQTVSYLPICPHLLPSGGAHRAEGRSVCVLSTAPISASRVLLCPCSSEQHQSWSRGRLLGVPRKAEPSRPLLRATLPPHSRSLHPSFLPSTVFSFFRRTPHSFIVASSALLLSLCPSPCASLSLFYSPSRYLPPLIIVLLPCGPSPPSPPSPAGVSIGCGRPFPGTGAPLPLPEPRGWWGLRGAQTYGRGAEGPRIHPPLPGPFPRPARRGRWASPGRGTRSSGSARRGSLPPGGLWSTAVREGKGTSMTRILPGKRRKMYIPTTCKYPAALPALPRCLPRG